MEISGVGSSQLDQYKYAVKQAESQVSSSQESDIPEDSEGTAAKPVSSGTEAASSQAVSTSQPANTAAALSTASTASTTDSESDAAYQAIVNKANSGQELTSSELSTLRSKDAALYAKAVRAQQAREELRKQMEANPSHASQSAHNAVASVSTSASKSDEDTQEITRRALNDEYRNFASKYDQVTISRQMTQDIASTGKNIV